MRLKVIGDRTKFSDDIASLIEESEAKTAQNTRITLLMALSYGDAMKSFGPQKLGKSRRAL